MALLPFRRNSHSEFLRSEKIHRLRPGSNPRTSDPEVSITTGPPGSTSASRIYMGVKGDWDFWISDLVKTLMELIHNPYGKFRWRPEGPVSQIQSPHLHVGAPAIFSDLWRSVQMLTREWSAEATASIYLQDQRLQFYWVCGGRPPFWRTCNLGSCICSEKPARGQNTLMMMIYTV